MGWYGRKLTSSCVTLQSVVCCTRIRLYAFSSIGLRRTTYALMSLSGSDIVDRSSKTSSTVAVVRATTRFHGLQCISSFTADDWYYNRRSSSNNIADPRTSGPHDDCRSQFGETNNPIEKCLGRPVITRNAAIRSLSTNDVCPSFFSHQ